MNIKFGRKIEKQMLKRGWTKKLISDTITNPYRVISVKDTRYLADGKRINDPATAYMNRDNSYLICNDKTGDIVQISDRNNPNWILPFQRS